ncbi:MAG: hypothetical protein RL320_1732 [Pseudomonadota bacterium]|jgi:hypothetical protein
MNTTPDPSHDLPLKAALKSLPSPEPSHGFDARLVQVLSDLPQSPSEPVWVGHLALAGAERQDVGAPWSHRSGWSRSGWSLWAGIAFAVVLAVSTAAWMQTSSPMPTDLREPDTLSVLSFGVL